MNVFQKTGTFVIRLFALAMIVIAVMGACMFAVHTARGTVEPIVTEKAIAAVEWLISGVVLLVVSKPLGKLVGAGLG